MSQANPSLRFVGRHLPVPAFVIESQTFGHGPHVCIGAALTIIEAEIAFRAILARWPRIAPADERPSWDGNPVYRGLKSPHIEYRCMRILRGRRRPS